MRRDVESPPHIDALIERRIRRLGASFPLFYDRPLHLVRGEGVWLFDAEGRRYLDAFNNVPHVGHCHPHVAEALCRQARTLNTHTRYLHESILDYGDKLTATMDGDLSMLRLCCTGTEANELALRIAKACTGHDGVIVSDFCYHGNSAAMAALSTAVSVPEGVGTNVRAISVPHRRDGRGDANAVSAARSCATGIEEAIASFAARDLKPAALLVDPVFAMEGLPDVPKGYLEHAVSAVRAAGGLYIADEVQAGLGRMGATTWGYQHYDIVPDLVTLGKPLGNGHPLAGVVGSPRLINAFAERALYFNTFGGNPVSCAVGLAVLEVMNEEGLVENARVVGAHLQAGLRRLADKHALVGGVRGRGLLIGVELIEDRATMRPATQQATAIANAMSRHGVLINTMGPGRNILRIRPPMPFAIEHADLLLSTLDDVLAAL